MQGTTKILGIFRWKAEQQQQGRWVVNEPLAAGAWTDGRTNEHKDQLCKDWKYSGALTKALANISLNCKYI